MAKRKLPKPKEAGDPEVNNRKVIEADSTDHDGGEAKSATRASIASEDDCLRALTQIPGLVAMKMLSTAQANSMRGVYSAILQHHQKNHHVPGDTGLGDADVLELLRHKPEMISMLEPLLTDKQIEMLMRDAKDGENEQT